MACMEAAVVVKQVPVQNNGTCTDTREVMSMDAELLPPPAVAEPTAARTALTSVTPLIVSEVVTETW
jgi:hypothetical protein